MVGPGSCHPVEAESQIIPGTDPFGCIDAAGLKRCEQLGARQGDRGAAGTPQHLAADALQAHFETLEIGKAVDRAIEPTAHLHA